VIFIGVATGRSKVTIARAPSVCVRTTLMIDPIRDFTPVNPQRRKLLTATASGAAMLGAMAALGIGITPSALGAVPDAIRRASSGRRSTARYATVRVGEVDIFYRSEGPANAPVVLLLHGFPSSSHQYRDLMPILAQKYRVIAPDFPGFGQTKAPPRGQYAYTFDNMSKAIEGFVDALSLRKYVLYLFDYGAPTGLRLAMAHPDRVLALVSQSGNAYIEGLSAGWAPWQKYWKEETQANRDACRVFLGADFTRDVQYLKGSDASKISPDSWTLDNAFLARPGNDEIQLDLILDYRTNVALYPKFQEYLRTHRPPTLAVWGKNDPIFIPPGAEAYKRDVPDTELHFVDAGHFALESHVDDIAGYMFNFLGRRLPPA
jgi:pimeloyl-ACP methyl ester carboxylesterase